MGCGNTDFAERHLNRAAGKFCQYFWERNGQHETLGVYGPYFRPQAGRKRGEHRREGNLHIIAIRFNDELGGHLRLGRGIVRPFSDGRRGPLEQISAEIANLEFDALRKFAHDDCRLSSDARPDCLSKIDGLLGSHPVGFPFRLAPGLTNDSCFFSLRNQLPEQGNIHAKEDGDAE